MKKKARMTKEQKAQYLTMIENWKTTKSTTVAMANTCNITANLCHLLKDSIRNDNIEIDSVMNTTSSTAADNDVDNTNDDQHHKQQEQALDWNQIAQDKALQELNTLYEEYSYTIAKDASLTDEIRRHQLNKQGKGGGGDSDEVQQHSEDSLVYGEIDLHGFCQLLNDCILPHTTKEDVFYDLGSGSGRAVFAARFVSDMKECIGIELLENLHNLAMSVASLYKFQYNHKFIHQEVKFVCSDLLNYEDWWTNGTVVYIPNLLFDDRLQNQIASKAKYVPPQAFWICLKKFPTTSATADTSEPSFYSIFELADQRLVPMSWGESNVYVYRRRA